ncbi:MAG: phosphoglycerate mutase [Hyphomicrobiales bacterium]|nr:phosphoglycerate mutase [Hyphomicrobiales bacterium]
MIVDLPHRLIVLRHGETDWNAAGRLQGHVDIALNAKGEAQAEECGRIIGRILGRDRDRLDAFHYVSSPLQRSRRTMELARGALGLDPFTYKLDDRLMELSFGEWEGMTWPQVKAHSPYMAAEREADKWSLQPPGGESYAMLSSRIQPWLETLEHDTIAVAHGGVARCLMHLVGGAARERAPALDIWQGRVLVFGKGEFRWI